jgi:hypothetical protein
MRHLLIAVSLLVAAGVLNACGSERKPIDPNLMRAPDDRPPPQPGLFTGDDGVWTIDID